MKFSVFTSLSIYIQVEVEAEDHLDAAHQVALAAHGDDFLGQHPDYMVDAVELEIVTEAEQRAVEGDALSFGAFNERIQTFTAETINGWLQELAASEPIRDVTL